MKYIMLETEHGAKLPIIFPDCLTHSLVAGAIQMAVDALNKTKDLRPKQCEGLLERAAAPPINAGFISLNDVKVHGLSESLELKHNPVDAQRILLGEAVQFMPDDMVQVLGNKMLLADG